MDRRKVWRDQEQDLVARWNAAAARQQEVQGELARHTDAGTAPTAELLLAAERSRTEMEAVRREVARVKVQFVNGRRY